MIRAPIYYVFQNCKYAYPNIKFRYTSTEEIEKIIKSLNTKNAHGHHEISIKILKWSAPFISSPLTYIFNKSLEYSTVIPIFKTRDKLDMSNFRPISLLISFSKIFERIIVQEFMDM